jgi:diaminopimelate epimerase
MMEFHKMHGLGNDFMVIDSRQQAFDMSACNWTQLADRRTGIGCDQFLILGDPDSSGVTASYEVRNADGSSAEQCGNGIRCLAMYLKDRGEVAMEEFLLAGPVGLIRVQCQPDETYRVNMGQPIFTAADIPINLDGKSGTYALSTQRGMVRIGAVSMGNPHAVIIDNSGFDPLLGAEISTHPAFPRGCNAGFVHVHDRTSIGLQVYERGSGPTRACGSGACAAVAVLRLLDKVDTSVRVDQPGGRLVIEWLGGQEDLWMSGPAAYVYRGQTDL